MNGLEVLSAVIGWTYFVLWSCSFYGQVVLNFQRKSVEGLSLDYTWLNAFGHGSYATFTTAMFFSKTVREQYRRIYGGSDSSVRANDVAFADHAFTLALLTLLQTFWYPRAPGQKLSRFNTVVILLFIFWLTLDGILVAASSEQVIALLYHLSYFKLYVSVAKYVPQAWLNYERKSTVGWSIVNVVLDFSGGVLSLIQLLLDSWLARDWTAITGNPVKLGLSLLSLSFAILFMTQHFILYRDAEGGQSLPQLEDGPAAGPTLREAALEDTDDPPAPRSDPPLPDDQTPLLRS